jgi:hypothetical protein
MDTPRNLQPRDFDVLRAVGRFRMLTRPQVKRWLFPEVTEPVVTRFMNRAEKGGYLGVERLHGNGMQVLWLTRRGRDLLVARGTPGADLFPATGHVAAKDFEHTAMIGEAAVWLATRNPAPDELLPAWTLQRFFAGRMAVIPDLLAAWRGDGHGDAGLAVEVDLGTEPLATVLLPKLITLARTLRDWLPESLLTILVLVPTARRRDALTGMLPEIGIPCAIEVMDDCFRVLTPP